MNLPNKLTVTRIILVPILILIYMFPYATFGINVPMYHILNADISLVNIVKLLFFCAPQSICGTPHTACRAKTGAVQGNKGV